jgi:Ca-activated chloride channel homolog
MIRALSLDELNDVAGSPDDAGFGAITTDKGCLPLRVLDVDVAIEGLSAATFVRQVFANVFAEPLEATYIFPLPPRAAVTGFRMTVNGTVVEGRIDERGKARADYDEAIASGRHAAIAEEERPNVFTLRVGNIPPKAAVLVEFTLVAPVAVDALEATYRFPLIVAPRYCPGVPLDGEAVGDGILPDTDRVSDASRISPPVLLPGMPSPVALGMRIRLGRLTQAAGKSTDRELACTLPVTEAVEADGSRLVTLADAQRLDRDFIFRWRIGSDAGSTATVLVEPDAGRSRGLGHGTPAAEATGDGTFALTIVPPAARSDLRRPRDVVFVLDRSGSMGGWQIVAARRAVARMIDTLSGDDRVGILAFDNSIEHPGPAPAIEPATDRHRWELLEWLATVEARGGTEIASALARGFELAESAAAGPASAGRDRFIVLVTDGQVGNEDAVLRQLATSTRSARLFVVGIDTAVNDGLLGRLADATGGQVELVESEDRLDEVMERIQSRITAPAVTDLTLAGDGIEIVIESLVPARMPDLVAGVPLVVRGRYRGTAAGHVHVSGRDANGEAWSAAATVAPEPVAGIGSLWARGRLRHLEDRLVTEADDTLESRIVDLSTSFGVLCRFTALVAIDPNDPDRAVADAPMRRIIQPVAFAVRHDACCYMMEPLGERRTNQRLLSRVSGVVPPSTASWLSSLGDFFDAGFTEDPLDRVRFQAADLVAKVRPRNGDPQSVSPAKVKRLLRGTLALLEALGQTGGQAEGVTEEIERIGAAFALVHARKTASSVEPTSLVRLLDVLADFAGVPADRRWWVEVA